MTMRVSLVVAAARNGVIGVDREIPWRLPDDQRFFRALTTGHAIVIGRKTFDSIGRPLPGRRNLVLTRRTPPEIDGIEFFPSLADALAWARKQDLEECFIAGGEAIYREGLEVADRIYRTLVEAEPEGDTRFPEIDVAHWQRIDADFHPIDDRHAHAFTIETWERRNDA